MMHVKSKPMYIRSKPLSDKIILAISKVNKINSLIEETELSAVNARDHMTSVRDGLSNSDRVGFLKSKKTIGTLDYKIKKSVAEQQKRFNSLSKDLLRQRDDLLNLDLNSIDKTYSQYEIDYSIKEINQDLNNIDSWTVTEKKFEKIDFHNHNGLRGMIFTPIADFNRKSEKLENEIYELNLLLNEIRKESLSLELEKFMAMKNPEVFKTQSDQTEMLTHYSSEFDKGHEGSSMVGSQIEPVKTSLPLCGCGGIGRTAFCV